MLPYSTYIPVLPSYLIEMCEAPTPYIIGLMRSCKSELAKYRGVSDMLIVDLDKQKFIYDTQNNGKIIPDNIVKSLKVDLYNLIHSSRLVTEYDKNVELCRVFLKIFVKTCGNYANFISAPPQQQQLEVSETTYLNDFMVGLFKIGTKN